jgi:chromosome segregation ATPase
LRTAPLALEAHSREIEAAGSKAEKELETVSERRDGLTVQLRQAEQSYRDLQAELVSLRAEHERTLLNTAALQSKVDDLAADQERRLDDDERFLASDRDPRELTGGPQALYHRCFRCR